MSGNFLEHLESRLGGIKHVEGPEVSGANRGYALIHSILEDPGVATVTTNGLRFQQITSLLPEELTCSLQDDQEHFARYLVDTTASSVVGSGRGLEFEQLVDHRRPIIKDTKIHGLLASPSPYFGGEFDLCERELQIITLIPVTAEEAAYIDEADAEEMFDIWREKRTNLLDVYRESAL